MHLAKIYQYDYLRSTKIVNDYLHTKEPISHFFSYPQFSIEDIIQQSRLIRERPKDIRKAEQLVTALLAYNKKLGCNSNTIKNIELLKNPRCSAVITGQQASFLTGAAFVIYKVITAITLALKISNETKEPVVPIFWIASEDHDFAEVSYSSFMLPNKQLRRYSIANSLPGLPPVGNIPVGKDVLTVISELKKEFYNLESIRILLDEVAVIAKRASSLTDFYGSLMTKLFDEYGLIIVDPMVPELRQLLRPLGKKVFLQHEKINEIIGKSAQALTSYGYDPVFNSETTGQLPIFYEINGQREPIFINAAGKAVIGKNTPLVMAIDELQQQYLAAPEKFSPNALLRPIFQDYLFPTVAYVGGPGEINYLAQIKELYQIFEINMPVIFPRARVTLITKEINDYLNNNSLEFPLSTKVISVFKDKVVLEKDINGFLDDFHQKMTLALEAYNSLITMVHKFEPGLDELAQSNFNIINHQARYLQKKVWQVHKKKYKSEIENIDFIYKLLHPYGREQEMEINFLSLMGIFGKDLIKRLMKIDFIHHNEKHKLILLEVDN
ncbi:MAG: bacillithiol biosynthesis cysteine-adding enzyme BshC [Bacillota bacterium]|nr:bacillithiol biosynthesis cysteine-adding enzyme BshC [Bacillota bacterium]